ncbi:MAG: hypothetical protein PHE86_03895 [Candidatus Marinimicrobia bacterium]|nr:hypothetical protein [Candidatus Neomarinimicrobiota bacterium]MDD5582093.1 hypothetical protein [Candidatus Neomarinimicrobiota bacterium]
MKKCIKITILALCLGSMLRAQYVPAPTQLINTPTVATLARGSYMTDLRFTTHGGVLIGAFVGLTDRFLMGISYGGSHIIGNQAISWNPQPGVQVKYRVIDEGLKIPGVSIGFSSQGYGSYIDEHYEIPSPGFYAVASKNWQFLGNTSLHGGINYSLEQAEESHIPSFFLGAAMELNPQFSLMVEYDAALNYEKFSDLEKFKISSGYGFLNAGARIGLTDNLYLEIEFNNLIWGDNVESFNREIKLIYFDLF